MHVQSQQYGASFLVDEVRPEDVVCREDMSDDERLLMRSIKEFAEQEVAPLFEEIAQRNIDVIRPLFKKAADLGLFMAEVPEALGGLGLSVLAIAGMSECRSYLGGLSSTVFAHQGIGTLPLINFGTPDQIDRYLTRCMNGDLMAAFALTEPGSGSDAMNITTSAVLSDDGSHYVVNGGKQWITNAAWADIFILFVKVDGEHFSTLIMDRDSEGLSIGADERLLGQHGASINAMSIDNVKVPVENVLGEVGKGHKVAFCTLNVGRLKLATNSASGARKAVEVAAQYAAERIQFGRPIGDFGLIQRKLADMASRAYAAESVAYRTSGLVYHALEDTDGMGPPTLDDKLNTLTEFSAECAMAKVFTSEAYNALADEALQVFGGYGFSEEYSPARMYRDSRITRIYEGTNEICRLYTQRAMLRRAWKGDLDFDSAIEALSEEAPNGGLEALQHADSNWGFEPIASGIRDLKKIYFYLVQAVSEGIEKDRMFDADNQQYMASLADVAIEIFGAESTYLRVAKHKLAGAPGSDLAEALARICFQRSVERIGSEANEILSALAEHGDLRSHLDHISKWLPLPAGLIETRAFVARSVLDIGGLPASMTWSRGVSAPSSWMSA